MQFICDRRIVDEPTAGLDPEERNRFLNLLAEIGENVVVILSTHIVDDVSDLCPNMAIMAEGGIIARGSPQELTAGLDGRIWSKTVDKHEVDSHRADFEIISTRLFAGRTILHAYSEGHPGAGFETVAANLEDVYFHALSNLRQAEEVRAAA